MDVYVITCFFGADLCIYPYAYKTKEEAEKIAFLFRTTLDGVQVKKLTIIT